MTESLTGLPILLHKSQMKPIDQTRSIHQRFTTGAEIGFYDNDLSEWFSGNIQVRKYIKLCVRSLRSHPIM